MSCLILWFLKRNDFPVTIGKYLRKNISICLVIINVEIMKIAVIAVIIFACCIMVSSCNKKLCPAYSQTDTEQSENVG